jgi:protein-disulfide isomerase
VRVSHWIRWTLLGVVLGLLLWQGSTQATAQTKTAKAAPAAAPAPLKALGVKSAPITVEVFSDFQCPACKGLYEQTLRPLIDNYVSTGKVYLVHRDFPLEQLHKHARQAARYANAAGRLGKFERVVEALYAKQEQWSLDGNVEGVVAAALTPAEMKQVRGWVQQPAQLDAVIDQDVRLGNRVPVRSTPTVVVLHAGATYPLPPGGVNYSLLRQFLDDLLRR